MPARGGGDVNPDADLETHGSLSDISISDLSVLTHSEVLEAVEQAESEIDDQVDDASVDDDEQGHGGGRPGRASGSTLFPGRHSKDKREAILKLLPYVQAELRGSTIQNPGMLDRYARRAFIRSGIDAAAAADPNNVIWGPGPNAVYKAKASVEDAIGNLYWDFVCNDL